MARILTLQGPFKDFLVISTPHLEKELGSVKLAEDLSAYLDLDGAVVHLLVEVAG